MVQGVHRKLQVSNSNGLILSQFFPFFPKTGYVTKPNNGCPENYCISLGCEWAPVEVETGFTWSAAGGERGAVKLFHILQTGVLAITGCSLGVLVEQSSSVFNVVIFFTQLKPYHWPRSYLLLQKIPCMKEVKIISWSSGHQVTVEHSLDLLRLQHHASLISDFWHEHPHQPLTVPQELGQSVPLWWKLTFLIRSWSELQPPCRGQQAHHRLTLTVLTWSALPNLLKWRRRYFLTRSCSSRHRH